MRNMGLEVPKSYGKLENTFKKFNGTTLKIPEFRTHKIDVLPIRNQQNRASCKTQVNFFSGHYSFIWGS